MHGEPARHGFAMLFGLVLACACGSDGTATGTKHDTDASDAANTGATSSGGATGTAGSSSGGGTGTAGSSNGGTTGTAGTSNDGAVSAGGAAVDASTPMDASSDGSDAGYTPPSGWTTGASMPTVRTELAAAELDGKIYVAGGYGGLHAFEAYDPRKDAWAKLKDMPVDLEHPSLGAIGGAVYLTGGNHFDTFRYDPASDTWTPRAPLLYSRYAAPAVVLGSFLYIVGGTGPNAPTLQRYDPTADEWTALAPMSILRDHVAAVALNGKIYALGGRPGAGAVYATVEIYDPVTNKWSPGVDMQEGRSGFGAAVLSGHIIVMGGEVLVNPYSVRMTAESFDPAASKWSFLPPLPGPLHGISAVAYDGAVYVFGGASQAASATPRTGVVYVLR